MRNDPGLPRWGQLITRSLSGKEGGRRVRDDVMTEAEVGML